ncbi:MAG: hypothetical protein J0H74_05525 [Chitinophagaceae bacterium]|nr:hypothetical protein [Chitinophagaceae bacterium]
MKRRTFLQQAAGWAFVGRLGTVAMSDGRSGRPAGPGRPVFVYNNWSAYDELSDKVVQTEALAMRELQEILRLRRQGVQIDYYVMDAFWFDKHGGYRVWHREHWPNGPDGWLKACLDNKIIPGMWFSTNLIATHDGRFLEPVSEWLDSVGTDPNILSLFEGGYLAHLAETLQLWYDKGVRLFKFDFAYFEAVTKASKDKFSPEEIKEKNKTAFMHMLQQFRIRHPDVLITGYNGFGGDMENTYTPFRRTVDPRWLETFDTLYCGDPRFSDVPMMNIWRSQDNYSDHMARQFEFNGLPLRRIDNCAFMIGKTGTCYYRAGHAWKGMLLLELARGGWMNVYHGNLELLSDEDARWFARAQRLYHGMQQADGISSFGAVPGSGRPYGFKATDARGSIFTVVNPSQEISSVALSFAKNGSRILYADGGFKPTVKDKRLILGTEQMAVVGTGAYADESYLLGTDPTVRIPLTQQRMDVDFRTAGAGMISGVAYPLRGKDIRIVLQQFGPDGFPYRSWGGAPPNGKKMDTLIGISARQEGRVLPLYIEYDKMIWSGLSWAAGELRQGSFVPALPVEITCHTKEQQPLRLEARVYAVGY